MASHSHDEAFHEIQLNGKQLVFLFMAVTVVSVVIFLCGVLVGRGVRAERASSVADAALGTVTASETMPQRPPTAQTPTPAGSDPTVAAPPPAAEDLSYFKRLEKPDLSTEELKTSPTTEKLAARPTDKASSAATRGSSTENALSARTRAASTEKASSVGTRESPPEPKEPTRAPAAANQTAAEPAAHAYTVQIAALNIRTEAEAIASRLSSKGYSAYVIPPANGTPAVYRVRVGKFGTRREAETVAARLQKEEQFKPWITR